MSRTSSGKYKLTILARENNEKGNLLTRLAEDLFHSLGYHSCIFDVAKSGREIDIIGDHRQEAKRLVAECKAQKQPVGGDSINKFAGAVEAEKNESKLPVASYFVSVSGFTASAKTQEECFEPRRIILLDGSDVVAELIDSGIVVKPEVAVQMAAQNPTLKGYLFNDIELIGHAVGWVWAISMIGPLKEQSVSLMHADGKPLDADTAVAIYDLAVELKHSMRKNRLARPQYMINDNISRIREIKSRYVEFLRSEYGQITLEGLPADQEVGSQKFSLERLYVPLVLEEIKSSSEKAPQKNQAKVTEILEDKGSLSIGAALAKYPRMAVLGLPGAGKTTLLKRLAMAYAEEKVSDFTEDLPQRDWLPIVVRCRQISIDESLSILDVLHNTVVRAEMPDMVEDFTSLLQYTLRTGRVLLLIDGLDEIRDRSRRQAFVIQLRTFLARYPNVQMVLSSRQTGYREVAGAVHSVCQPLRVGPLSPQAITSLVTSWHRHVVGDSAAINAEAKSLAEVIISVDRIRRLAANPLLLTTLLLVKRWVGQLPRRRSVLYQKAVEVLLMTWNVEGHDPVDQDEAIPQLAFAAYRMMASGETSATSKELAAYFSEARSSLPEVLGYTTLSVRDFLDKVEERSSLLTLSGHRLEDGQIHDVYEFKHLTFQEYLAALAITEGYLPEAEQDKEIEDIIADRVGDESWSEVASLTVSLAGKRATKIISHLIDIMKDYEKTIEFNGDESFRLVHRISDPHPCNKVVFSALVDEVSISPRVAHKAIHWAIRGGDRFESTNDFAALLSGRYLDEIINVCLEGLREGDWTMSAFGSSLGMAACRKEINAGANSPESFMFRVNKLIGDESIDERLKGSTMFMNAAFQFVTGERARARSRSKVRFSRAGISLGFDLKPELLCVANSNLRDRLLLGRDLSVAEEYVSMWALCWSARYINWEQRQVEELRYHTLRRCQEAESRWIVREATWLAHVLPISRDSIALWQQEPEYRALGESDWLRDFLVEGGQADQYFDYAAPVISWLTNSARSEDVVARIKSKDRQHERDLHHHRTLFDILKIMASEGVVDAREMVESADDFIHGGKRGNDGA
ncbi:NACHT domain-containing protein [Spirillospora sp. NPDC050679]